MSMAAKTEVQQRQHFQTDILISLEQGTKKRSELDVSGNLGDTRVLDISFWSKQLIARGRVLKGRF